MNELESIGVMAGLGAITAVKRIRRIQEGVMILPKDFLELQQERKVADVNYYFDQMKTETIDGTVKD